MIGGQWSVETSRRPLTTDVVMLEEQNQENQEQPILPPCCNSGCTVCVLDYPELFLNQESASETKALLEAIERAQLSLAEVDGEEPREQLFTEEQ